MITNAIEQKITQYLPIIAYAVGYDISDPSANQFIKGIVEAGMEDMKRSGVSEALLISSKIVLSALIIFTNDNLNMSAGKYTVSPMYLANVDKLREIPEENNES